MACSSGIPHLSHKLVHSFPFRNPLTTSFPFRPTLPPQKFLTRRHSSDGFTWDDVLRISQPEALPDDPSDLKGYSNKIKICNRGLVSYIPILLSLLFSYKHFVHSYLNCSQEMQSEFHPFVIEDQIVGYIHNG